MDNKCNYFPAKILLFGEYTILLGSSALSIPYPEYNAALTLSENNKLPGSQRETTSNRHLFQFYQFLTGQGDDISHIFDFDRFHQDLTKGLFLKSTIPAGYGLGSSGALVAAIFDRFASHLSSRDEIATDEGLLNLKRIFSEMESFFHGRSSGFDPSVSFLKRPLLLRPDGVPELIELPKGFSASGAGIFLLDTGQTGKTSPLVKLFLERFRPEGKITQEGQNLAGLINDLVHAFLDCQSTLFWNLMKKVSVIQTEVFRPMIPGNLTSLWSEGIESWLFYMKLCGSGGGGYLIGFAPDLLKATAFLLDKGYNPIPLLDQ
jgi:mevalonate kinase